jgi:hypothetical protein
MKLYPIYQTAETMDIELAKELLEALIQDEPIYPWDPYTNESEDYFSEQEAELSLTDCWTSQELETHSNQFFVTLEKSWQTTPLVQIKTSLQQELDYKVPPRWLEKIINQAQDIFLANLSPLEQLVQCVKPLLSDWEDDDLQVFARPLVFAMRGQAEPSLNQFTTKDSWEELSPIEQARFTMAIAQYVLTELKSHQD